METMDLFVINTVFSKPSLHSEGKPAQQLHIAGELRIINCKPVKPLEYARCTGLSVLGILKSFGTLIDPWRSLGNGKIRKKSFIK